VGRHPEARFLLSDPRVARRHAYLEHVNGAWSVRDAGSFQGTYVNERRVEEAQLRAGDVVRMGVSFKVELE
jgi:adenylate cyclase